MRERIKNLVREILPELIDIRRHIHMHPELSFEECETMKFVSSKLQEWNVSHESAFAGNSIVGLIGDQNGPCIALRADMDALPMQEKTNVDYASKTDGVMHACGHDVHTTCLLGASYVLKRLEKDLPGNVKLLFQHAEEKLPGGAREMIEAGVLDQAPQPAAIIGLHVHPPLEVGKLGFKSGMFMASADELTVVVQGKGGHAAVPAEFTDPIIAAASFLTTVQQVVSRRSDPSIPTVVSFGQIETPGGSFNIIPEKVVIKGTLRTMDEGWRAEALKLIETCAHQVAHQAGCTASVHIIHGYPCLINDTELTNQMSVLTRELFGNDSVVELPFRMSAEDFARYAERIPAVFFRLGVRNESRGITAPVHSPYFDVDEEAIFYGASTLAWAAFSFVSR